MEDHTGKMTNTGFWLGLVPGLVILTLGFTSITNNPWHAPLLGHLDILDGVALLAAGIMWLLIAAFNKAAVFVVLIVVFTLHAGYHHFNAPIWQSLGIAIFMAGLFWVLRRLFVTDQSLERGTS